MAIRGERAAGYRLNVPRIASISVRCTQKTPFSPYTRDDDGVENRPAIGDRMETTVLFFRFAVILEVPYKLADTQTNRMFCVHFGKRHHYRCLMRRARAHSR